MRAYEYRHVVAFEETNVVGNVYYANHVRWQGRCREMFLRRHAPGVLEDLARGLYLVTTRVSCEYFDELRAFDEVVLKMYAKDLAPGRVTMAFDYMRVQADGQHLVARGEQQIASMRRENGVAVSAQLPHELRAALLEFVE
jgi:enediyne core biosynthesis thioesterase